MNVQKSIFLLIITIIASCLNLSASPAYPGLINFVQPDGSKINIYLKGDDKVHWAETEDGYSLLFNAQGTYEYAILDGYGDMVPSGKIAKNIAQRSTDDLVFLLNEPKHLRYSEEQVSIARRIDNMVNLKSQSVLKTFPLNTPTKLICILIGFTDKAITITNSDFENLFNQANYHLNGATGSVRDYFLESSYNQLDLTVTVAGPYVAAYNMAHYGENIYPHDSNYRNDIIKEAVRLADSNVNYADFDNDKDGTVDGVYVIYAGYGEEAGAPSECIWAHEGTISIESHDGKNISRFACSPEMAGNPTNNPDNKITTIGVICHEFGHTLGALDYYDTNFETDGQYNGTGNWDLESNGMWNNGGKTPAQPNPYNRCYIYNWATATDITDHSPSSITINNSSAQKDGSFYRINTTTTNEYFLLENRQQIGFDASIPGHGLLIYHVDGDYITTNSGGINIGSHQGMYVMAANSPTPNGVSISTSSKINTAGCTFSAANGKTSFTDATTPNSKSWAGVSTAKPITNITENNLNKTVTFDLKGGVSCTPPATQASGFNVSDITENSMTINWTMGNGNSVMVVARALEMVNNEPINGVDYTASTVFGNSNSELGTGNYVVFNGIGNSVNVSNLQEGYFYYFSIYETSATSCYKTPALTGNNITGGRCYSYGNMTYPTSITKVTFNTIDNTSGKPAGQCDYTSIKTAVDKGSSQTLSVNLNTGGDGTVYAMVWFDWNQNKSFNDPGESYDLGTVTTSDNGTTTLSPLSIPVPSDVAAGSTRMRVSCQYNGAPTSCSTNFDGEVEDYTVIVTTPVSWTGNLDTDWHTSTNWAPVGVPTDYCNVTIPNIAHDPVIGSSAQCYNVTIQSDAILTLASSGSFTVNNNLNNNAGISGLVLESTTGGTGSLKILGSVTGSASVNRYMSASKWHLVSPPAIGDLFDFLGRNLVIPFYGTSLSLGMADYNTEQKKWNDYYTTSSSGLMDVGKGYLVRTETPTSMAPTVLSFLGSLKSGNTIVTLTSGWNCIGNPFTSAININSLASTASGGSNFLSTNSSVLTGSFAAIYVWDETISTAEYQVINNSSGATYATVGQGFFVKGSGSINFTSDMQVHQGAVAYKAVNVHFPEITLVATGQTGSVSTKIKFIDGTTRGLDIGYDAGLFKSDNPLTLYTKLVEDNGVQFQLQCLPTDQYNSLVIPVGLESKAGGEVAFSVETVQLDPICKVILEDRLTNTFTDISKDTYKAAISANTSVSDRFFLHTSDLMSGLEDQKLFPNKLTAYAVGNVEIRVIGEVSDKAVATLYNGLGKVVLTKKLSSGNLNIIELKNLGSGVYLLNINDNGTAQTIKIRALKIR